ncbi:MAG TPA: peptidase M10 [Flavisolibacter sp.]
MGAAEIDVQERIISIHSHIVTYGNAADEEVTERIRSEIEMMWNEPAAAIFRNETHYRVVFRITAECRSNIDQMDVLRNTDPAHNYFRIEKFVHGDISFVDGLGCNTGYFKLENLYEGSTTAAHEYGHTLGLDHPRILDIRGQGVPGIMYPRGTLVDAPYQYDPTKPAGVTGGTMHPRFRKVTQHDIDLLKLNRIRFEERRAVIGAFTNIYHWNHAEMNP